DRRAIAVELRQHAADDRAEGLEVLVDAEERLLRVLRAGRRQAVARADRIDEDEVGRIEPGVGIVDQLWMRRRQSASAAEIENARPERGHVEIGRGRAGPAIQREGDRPLALVLAVARIGDIEHLRERLPFVVAELERAGARGIGEFLPGERYG